MLPADIATRSNSGVKLGIRFHVLLNYFLPSPLNYDVALQPLNAWKKRESGGDLSSY
jgi:hypothetical protein